MDMYSEFVELFFIVSIGIVCMIEVVLLFIVSLVLLMYYGVVVDVGKGFSFGLGLGSISSIFEG